MDVNKELQKLSFQCGSTPNASDFATLIDSTVGVLTDAMQLPFPSKEVEGTVYKINDNFHQCVKKDDGTFTWKVTSATGGVTSYLDLTDRPRINGTVISGNQTPQQLGILADNAGYDSTRPENNDFIYLVRGRTPFVCRVSDLISSGVMEDVETLEAITGTAPVLTGMVIGSTRYFNTTDQLIYIADTTTTWNPQGRVATEGNLYINKADNVPYRYENGQMIALGGAGGGTTATIEVGATNTGVAGTEAKVVNTGTDTAAVLEFTIPRGNAGIAGTAATIQVESVTTLPAGSAATVINAGTTSAARFNFGIPRGADGEGAEQTVYRSQNESTNYFPYFYNKFIVYTDFGEDVYIQLYKELTKAGKDFIVIIYNPADSKIVNINIDTPTLYKDEWVTDFEIKVPANTIREIHFAAIVDLYENITFRAIFG